MSTFKNPAIGEGWMRALLFLVIFTGAYLFGNWFLKQTSISDAINPIFTSASIFALSAIILVPLFWMMVDRKPLSAIGFNWKMSTKFSTRFLTLREPQHKNNEWQNHELVLTQPGKVSLTSQATVPSEEKLLATESNDGLLGLLMATALLGLGTLILYFNSNLDFTEGSGSHLDLVSGFILMSVIAIAEEAVFRGYILNNLLESLNPWFALIVAALAFAILHSGNPEAGLLALVNVFLAGLLVGLAFVYTRNLWFSVFFHFSWNFIQGPLLGFPVSGLRMKSVLDSTIEGDEMLTGGKFGLEASIIQTILFIIAIGLLYLFFQRRASAHYD